MQTAIERRMVEGIANAPPCFSVKSLVLYLFLQKGPENANQYREISIHSNPTRKSIYFTCSTEHISLVSSSNLTSCRLMPATTSIWKNSSLIKRRIYTRITIGHFPMNSLNWSTQTSFTRSMCDRTSPVSDRPTWLPRRRMWMNEPIHTWRRKTIERRQGNRRRISTLFITWRGHSSSCVSDVATF